MRPRIQHPAVDPEEQTVPLCFNDRPSSQFAWAKLRALRDGAAIASKKLWS